MAAAVRIGLEWCKTPRHANRESKEAISVNVSVDSTRCQGNGLCAVTAPTVFAVGDDGQADMLRQPTAGDRSAVEEAVRNCPTAALTIEP